MKEKIKRDKDLRAFVVDVSVSRIKRAQRKELMLEVVRFLLATLLIVSVFGAVFFFFAYLLR